MSSQINITTFWVIFLTTYNWVLALPQNSQPMGAE